MAPTSRQAVRSERSTNALLDAAAELIAEGGLASMTLAAIGERAGYSRGMVTARFGSKSAMVDALIRRLLTGLADKRSAPAGDGLTRLIGLIEAIRDLALAEPRDMRALLTLMFEALGADTELRAQMNRFHAAMESDIGAAIERGTRDGSVRADVDGHRATMLVLSLLRGLAYQWLLDPDPVELAASHDEIIAVLREHLTPTRGTLPRILRQGSQHPSS
jgi:AcrR family transcriptional regulator